MDKRSPASGRKPSVQAPNIALELTRAAACANHAHSILAPLGGLSTPHLVNIIAEELSKKTVGTGLERIVESLTATIWTHATVLLSTRIDEFTHLCSLPSFPIDPTEQARALRRVGVAVEDVTISSLARHSDLAPARTLLAIQHLQQILDQVESGTLPADLQQTYLDTTTDTPLEDTVAHLTSVGIDAERLCWALITFETNQHINLVWHFANKLTKTFPDRVPADLFGWGWQGLRVALRNFDPDRGFAFSTYAGTRIAGAIRDGVRSESPVPKRLTTYLRKVVKAEEDLTQGLGRAPRLEEVAAHLGEDLEQLSIIPRLAPTASIDELTDESRERVSTPRWLVDEADPAGAAIQASLSEAVAEALKNLPEEDRQAVKLLVMEGLDPKEARELTGVDSRKMRRYKERGLAALAEHLSGWEASKA